MGKWLALLDAEFQQLSSPCTAKTANTPVVSVLAVTLEGVSENSLAANDAPQALAPDAARTCAECQNLTRRRTCGDPEAAGLVEAFGIIWPEPEQATGCKAFDPKDVVPGLDLPYRLTAADGDRCHEGEWDDAEIARFQGRVRRLHAFGIRGDDAQELAECLTLRDRDDDELRMCLECSQHAPGRCGNHRRAGLHAPEVGRDLAALLQRCAGYQSTR